MQHRVGLETTGGLIAVISMRMRSGRWSAAASPASPSAASITSKSALVRQIPQELSVVLLILDDQDALAHAWPVCASTRTGTVK